MPPADDTTDRPPVYSFVYGIDLRPAHDVDSVTDARLTLTDGTTSPITMHLIEGSKEQIKAMLLQSIDAYFELHDEMG